MLLSEGDPVSHVTPHRPRPPSVCLKTQRILYPTQGSLGELPSIVTLRPSDTNEAGTTCMLYHAARVSKRALLPRVSSPEPANVWPSSGFTTALQTAAARAWTRTALRSLRTVSVSTSVTLDEENTGRTREPLPSVPSDVDSGSWKNVRQISA